MSRAALLLPLLLSAAALAQAPRAEPAPSPAPRATRELFLVSAGARMEDAEFYLRTLCNLLSRDPFARERYRRVVVLRHEADDLLTIMGQLRARRPGTPSVDASLLGQLKNLMARKDLSGCLEESKAFASERPDSPDEHLGRVDLIQLEALEPRAGRQEERLRVTRASLDPELPGDEFGKVDEPRYKDSSDEQEVARWLGRELLELPAESVLQAELKAEPKEIRECDQVGPPARCAMVTDSVMLSLELRDTLWLSSKDVQVGLQARCDTADQEGIQRALEQGVGLLRAGAANTEGAPARREALTGGQRLAIDFTVMARGSCRFEAVLTGGPGYRRTFSTAGPLEVRMLPVLVMVMGDVDPSYDRVMSLGTLELAVEQHKLGPWMKLSAHGPSPKYFQQLRVVSREDVLQFAARVRDSLLAIEVPTDIPEVVPVMSKDIRIMLEGYLDTLGPLVLLETRSSVCDSMGKRLRTRVEELSGMPAWFIAGWVQTCEGKVEQLRNDMASELKARPSPAFRLMTDPEEKRMVYRSIQNLQGRTSVDVTAEDIRFAERVERLYRPVEKFLLLGRDSAGELSVPKRLEVHSDPGVPNLEIGVALHVSYPLGFGADYNVGIPLLDRALIVDLGGGFQYPNPVEGMADAPVMGGVYASVGVDIVRSSQRLSELTTKRHTFVNREFPEWLVAGVGFDTLQGGLFTYMGYTLKLKGFRADLRFMLSPGAFRFRVGFPLVDL